VSHFTALSISRQSDRARALWMYCSDISFHEKTISIAAERAHMFKARNLAFHFCRDQSMISLESLAHDENVIGMNLDVEFQVGLMSDKPFSGPETGVPQRQERICKICIKSSSEISKCSGI
jgi:hypothetical protein